MHRDEIVQRIANRIGKDISGLVIGETEVRFTYKKERYRVSVGRFGQWLERLQVWEGRKMGYAPDRESKKLAKKLGFKR